MPAPDPAAANYEVRFMTKMIDHHAMAVMMAEMCVERAIHPDLTSMCTGIIANQQARDRNAADVAAPLVRHYL